MLWAQRIWGTSCKRYGESKMMINILILQKMILFQNV